MVKRHHWVVRVTHWVSAIAIFVMVGSGWRIFNAYPAFHRRGETFCCYPFEGKPIPGWLTFGGWLAGARNWHFAMMWVLVITGKYNPELSPEERNARPFYHLLPRPRRGAAEEARR